MSVAILSAFGRIAGTVLIATASMAEADEQEAPRLPGWREELRIFLEGMRRTEPPREQAREHHSRMLTQTLEEQVYPAFEEFLSEMTRNGIGGQIYGRGTGYAMTLRLDDGFEVAVERDRYREQGQTLPRLVFILYYEEGGRRFFTTDGISWDRITKPEVIGRLFEEYKRWRILRMLAGGR